MVLIDLQKVLSALGLVSSIAKPIPLVGGVAGGLLDTAGGVINSTAGSSTGALNGILGSGGLIAATNVTGNATYLTAAYTDTDSTSDTDSISSDNSTLTTSSLDNTTMNTSSTPSRPSCAVTPYTPPYDLTLQPFPAYDANKALIYRYRQQQSVNLGSWFVQEQWMNPSLFTCASGNKQAEFDVANGWGSVDGARQVLERHWDEWIQESDFAYLASIGINTVRIPIGYWSLGPVYCQGTPFESVSAAYVNSWPRIVRAINTAEKYGLGVLVDLHGAPGSQNGQGHSGVSDGQQNLFNNPTNVQLTINALTYLTQQLVKVNNVVGIQILNEPSNVDGLPAFYTQVLTVLRQVSPEAAAFPFYIHDGFDMSRFADYVSTRQDFVVLDHHSYFVFGDAASQETPASQLTNSLQPGSGSLSSQMISAATEERRNIVIDEFSCALSNDALINSTDPVGDRRKFCTGQMESYTNATAGWSFWSYKTEGCPGDVNWCFTSAVGNSLPSTFFSYPNVSVSSLTASSAPASTSDTTNTDTSFLSFGTSSPSTADYSPPTTDDWLAAMGASDPEYDHITEALATTEYDETPTDTSSPSPSSIAAAAVNPAEAAYAIGTNLETTSDNTVPSYRVEQLGNRKRSLGSLPQRAFLLSSSLQRHRFVARHRRAHARRSIGGGEKVRRDNNQSYTPEQGAIAKGYADGWKAAKTFAALGGSRLGFTGQFVSDALSAMGGQIISSDEQYYRTWFMKGLADGEVQVMKLMAMQAQGPQS